LKLEVDGVVNTPPERVIAIVVPEQVWVKLTPFKQPAPEE
jgi:hypothetical protein